MPSSAAEADTTNVLAGAAISCRADGVHFCQIALRAEQRELGRRLFQIPLGSGRRTRRGRHPPEGQMTQRRLVALAK